jgi:hypothetical protein
VVTVVTWYEGGVFLSVNAIVSSRFSLWYRKFCRLVAILRYNFDANIEIAICATTLPIDAPNYQSLPNRYPNLNSRQSTQPIELFHIRTGFFYVLITAAVYVFNYSGYTLYNILARIPDRSIVTGTWECYGWALPLFLSDDLERTIEAF